MARVAHEGRLSDALTRAGGLVVMLVVAALQLALPAAAQDTPGSGLLETYITPFPENESYRVVVLGDAFADGVWASLVETFSDDPSIQLIKKSDGANGITRSDETPWDSIVSTLAPNEVPHIAVAIFGVADRRSLRVEGSKLEVGSEGWLKEYARRVDDLLRALKRRGAAVYWIGLPIMRGPNTRRDTELMNNVFRERALLNGTKYISTWEAFADASGSYTDYGPDLTGKVRQLREDDGIHLTLRGYEKLVHFAEQEIRRDLTLARAERDVPLAGDEDEQRQAAQQARLASGLTGVENSTPTSPISEIADIPAATSSIAFGDAESLEIVRPALPGVVVAHLQRTLPGRPALVGKTLLSDLRGGLTALTSIASATEQIVSGGKPRIPLSQSPFYKVLIKGEPLPPKPGRADDFSWPKTSANLTD
ncbi:MAG: GDSL-type esterase/lipase family protein [Hyphomicrobiaceae bacterium]